VRREFISDAQTMHTNAMQLHKEIVEGMLHASKIFDV
jgi:hypothetical protein